MNLPESIDLDQIEECLGRSGYLMESRLVSSLNEAGFFVEPSQPFLDPRTSKSREIDLVAEFYSMESSVRHRGTCVKTYFVAEAVNNRYPFVLLTQRPSSPGANYEDYIKHIVTPAINPPFDDLLNDAVYTRRQPDSADLFSQFAELTRKSGKGGELMASHSEGTYGSLLKMSEYIEEQVTQAEDLGDSFWRVFFWRPIIVLGGQLVRVSLGIDGQPFLTHANFGQLEFNWHSNDRPRSTIVDIVTESHFLTHLTSICDADQKLEADIHALRPTANA